MIIKAEVDSKHLAMLTALVDSPENKSGPEGCKMFLEDIRLPERFVSIVEVKRGRRHEHLVILDVASAYNIERYGVLEARQLPASYLRKLVDALGVFPEPETNMKVTMVTPDAPRKLLTELIGYMHAFLTRQGLCESHLQIIYAALKAYAKSEISPSEFIDQCGTVNSFTRENAERIVALVEGSANATIKPAEPKPGVIPLTPEFLRAFHAIDTLPLEYHPHTFGAWLVGILVRYYENAPDLRSQLDQAGALNSQLKDDLYFKLIVAHLRKHCLGETE